MAWPHSQDYNEALQNPQTSFSDPELRQGEVVTNALGIPQPCSGNFADVYAVECARQQNQVGRQVLHPRSARPARTLQRHQQLPETSQSSIHRRFPVSGAGHPHRRPLVSNPQDALGRGLHTQRLCPRQPRQAGLAGGVESHLAEDGRTPSRGEPGALRFAAWQCPAGALYRPLPADQADRLRRHVGASAGTDAIGRGRPCRLSAPRAAANGRL